MNAGAVAGDDAASRAQCCIVDGGPAGMMLGYLLARAGVTTTVHERPQVAVPSCRCACFPRCAHGRAGPKRA